MMLLILVLAVLLFFSGLFSASETALFSLSSLKVKTYKQDKDPRKQLICSTPFLSKTASRHNHHAECLGQYLSSKRHRFDFWTGLQLGSQRRRAACINV